MFLVRSYDGWNSFKVGGDSAELHGKCQCLEGDVARKQAADGCEIENLCEELINIVFCYDMFNLP